MARHSRRGEEAKWGSGWDYSGHPQKAGGRTIVVMVVGWTAGMLALALGLLWLWLR